VRTSRRTGSIGRLALTTLAALVMAFVMLGVPGEAWAVVDCTTVLAGADPGPTGADSDADGFTDYQECAGISLADGTPFPSCVPTLPTGGRSACLHPDSKDLFVILAPATGSLLPANYAPFNGPTYYGVTFQGLSALGLTVHQISPAQANPDRSVAGGSPQKAVKVTESLDGSGTILGYCQWGTPMGLDGCTVYTQRIRNFISSTCGSSPIVNAGGATTTLDDAALAYATHTVLHETGHTSGGMTSAYNSSYGGYHYKAGSGTRMEQYVTYTTKGGKCKFNFAAVWNSTDATTVRLK
jgi:hypothetical protein